jgi:hypothetical protein
LDFHGVRLIGFDSQTVSRVLLTAALYVAVTGERSLLTTSPAISRRS